MAIIITLGGIYMTDSTAVKVYNAKSLTLPQAPVSDIYSGNYGEQELRLISLPVFGLRNHCWIYGSVIFNGYREQLRLLTLVLSTARLFQLQILPGRGVATSLTISGNKVQRWQTWYLGSGTAVCATGSSGFCFDSSIDTPAMYVGTAGNVILNGTLSQSGNPDVAENIHVLDSGIDAGDIVSSIIYNSANPNIYDQALASNKCCYSTNIIMQFPKETAC
jgi:hypothetical protein